MRPSLRLLPALLFALVAPMTLDAAGTFNAPGNLLIADSSNYRVIEVDPASKEILWTFAPKKDPNDACATAEIYPYSAFRLPPPSELTLIAADAYGCGSWVYLVDKSATIVWQYGGYGDADHSVPVLRVATFAVMTEQRTVLITDRDAKAILEVDLDKHIVNQYTPGGGVLADLVQPTATLPAGDNWLVTDNGANKVIEMKRDGTVIRTWTQSLSEPTFAALQKDGSLLIVDSGNNRVVSWKAGGSDGEFQWALAPNADPDITSDDDLWGPTGAQQLSNGSVLIADHKDHRVITVSDPTKNGDYVYSYGQKGAASNTADHLDSPNWAHLVGEFNGLPMPNTVNLQLTSSQAGGTTSGTSTPPTTGGTTPPGSTTPPTNGGTTNGDNTGTTTPPTNGGTTTPPTNGGTPTSGDNTHSAATHAASASAATLVVIGFAAWAAANL